MRAAIYCRLSKEDEHKTGESESIQNQKSMLIEYAVQKGFDIYQIYSDEDYSGIDRDRPAFNAMLEAARQHKFDVVLAKTQSRFTRDMELVEKYLHGKFVEWGIRFIAVVDHVDTDDRANKKSRQINGLVNEWYLEDLSNNVRSVLDHKRREGQYIASFALYGYRKDPDARGHLVIDPEAAAVVERMFEMARSGIGTHKIAQILNSEGVPSPTAYKQQHGVPYKAAMQGPEPPLWGPATVYQMLRNRTYTGDLVQGRHKKVSYKSKRTVWLPTSQWIVVPGTHEPIIDRETFKTVQQMLQGRARSGVGGQVHPLARLVVCGSCGAVMEQTGSGSVRTDGARRRYLRCRTHQRAPERCSNKTCTSLDALQDLVLERIREYAASWFDPQQVELPETDTPARRRVQALKEERRRLQTDVDRRRKAIQELYLDKVSGLIDTETFAQMNAAFLQQVQQAEARIAVLEADLGQQQVREDARAAQMERVTELAKVPVLTRELAVLLVHRVVVSPKDPETGQQAVTIEWNF